MLLGVAVPLLSGCGGGGGSAGSSNDGVRYEVRFEVPRADVQALQQIPMQQRIGISIFTTAPEDREVFVAVRGGTAVLQDLDFEDLFGVPNLVLLFRDDLPPGRYTDTLELRLCADENCNAQLPGGPFLLPLSLDVRTNILVSEQAVGFGRTGREPSQTATVEVSVPEPGLQLQIRPQDAGSSKVIQAGLTGTSVRISFEEAQAGEYYRRFLITSTDGRFSNFVDVWYVVTAPPTGEQGLVLGEPTVSLVTYETGTLRRRVAITPATWTSAITMTSEFIPAQVHFERTGPDEYELVVDPGLAPGTYRFQYALRPTTGNVAPSYQTFEVRIQADIVLPTMSAVEITAATTPEQLRFVLPIDTVDRAQVGWSVSGQSSFVRVVRGAGVTGVDPLEFELVPERMRPGMSDPFGIEIRLDRPGSSPQQFFSFVRSRLTWIDSGSESAWVDGLPLTLRLVGAFPERIDQTGALQVTGASASAVRFGPTGQDGSGLGGPPRWMEIDLGSLQEGVPVEVRVNNVVALQRHRLEVRSAQSWTTQVFPLPHRQWRPPVYSGRQRAFYFTGGDSLTRIAWDGRAWALGDRRWADLIDADLTADETELAVWRENTVQRVDATMLGDTAGTEISGLVLSDAMRATHLKIVRVGLDNTAWWLEYGPTPWTCFGFAGFNTLPSRFPLVGRRFDYLLHDCTTVIAGTIALAGNRTRAEFVPLTGPASGATYDFLQQSFRPWASPTQPSFGSVAMNYSGSLLIDGAGRIYADNARQLARPTVFAALRPGEVGAATALSPDGRLAYVYAFTPVGSGSGAQASAPRLVAFDLSSPWDWSGAVPTIDIALSQPLGCRPGRPVDEACDHRGHIAIEPSGRNALLVGPDAAIAVALPAQSASQSLAFAGSASRMSERRDARPLRTPASSASRATATRPAAARAR